jgi:hypothetical protein
MAPYQASPNLAAAVVAGAKLSVTPPCLGRGSISAAPRQQNRRDHPLRGRLLIGCPHA